MRRLLAQLFGLERRTARGGRDVIDHGPGGHDDLANAVAGALVGVGRAPACMLGCPPEDECGGLHLITLDGGPSLRRAPADPRDLDLAPDPDPWRRAVEPTWGAADADPALSVVVAVVFATELDVAAVVMTRDAVDDLEVLLRYTVGTRATVEAHVLRWTAEYRVERIDVTGIAEPFPVGLHQLVAAWRAADWPVERIGTAAATQAWMHCRDRLEVGGIVLYALPTLREATTQRAIALGVAACAAVLVEATP